MTTFDDKNKIVADEAGNSKQADTAGYIILFFFIGLVASLVLGWVIYPNLLYSKKSQPIDFNHALHMEEVDNGCESCHFFRKDGTFSGAPTLQQCIECHEEPMGETTEELKFVEEYVSKQREVPWLIYSKQPDCVFFSHAAHVLAGKMDCVFCHGHIGESESLKPYQVNRITGYSRDIWGTNIGGFKKNSWDRMKMDDCSECHVRENVRQASVQTEKGGCFVCHK
ncbi:MAG: cytochrome C [Desulfobacteraceae bacterium 4572_123]|nr:MAG: cytochrome C [Desulfobacteraceae bacterium 4572_123]